MQIKIRKFLSKIGWNSFKEGICNLVKWFPLIWKDRDFDHNYFYRLLHKKLENMEKFFRSEYTYSVGATLLAEDIKEAKEIVQRLLEDKYFTDLVEDIPTEEIFNFDNGKFNANRDHPQYKDWTDSSILADKIREDDKAKLFELLRQKVDDWWD